MRHRKLTVCVTLEVKAHLGGNSTVTCTAAATDTASATTAWSESAKAAVKCKALTEERRRQVADWRRQVHVIEQILEV